MIEINGKIYRNIQEQVQENMNDIEDLDERVTTIEETPVYTKDEADAKFQTIAGMSTYATKSEIPTKTSDLTNDSGYITSSALTGYQTTSNLVTSISSSSTDTQYPSAKCMYDILGNVETLLAAI